MAPDADERQQVSANGRAPSPSALSTASSNSPLVRNGSSSSSVSSSSSTSSKGSHFNKRPAPTSIAAAQLQCQQQQQQHFQSKADNGNKLAKIMMAPSQQQNQMTSNSVDKCQHRQPQQATANGKKKLEANGKSFGYNVAKAMAFRANRFNEFWSINKMRYLNLACLLMTIVCLITILLFSSFDRSSSKGRMESPRHLHNRRNGHQLANSDTSGPESTNQQHRHHLAESLESLDKQPLERPQQQTTAKVDELSGSSSLDGEPDDEDQPSLSSSSSSESIAKLDVGDNTTDGFSLFDDLQTATATPSDESKWSGSQREVEELAGGARRRAPTSFIDPVLSQVFEELDGFNPFRVLRESAKVNYTSMKPIVKQTKDGTTIIIRSGGFSSVFNNSSGGPTNDSTSISSLIEKILPPMFKPLSMLSSMQRMNAGKGTGNGVATITINSEPFMAASSPAGSSPFASPRLPFQLDQAPGLPFAGAFPFVRVSSVPRQPFFVSSSMQSAPATLPGLPGSLLSMIVRASEMASEAADLEQARANSTNTTLKPSSNSTSDPVLSSQASQLNNQTVTLNGTAPANSTGNKWPLDAEDEVETFDVNQGPRGSQHHLPSLFAPKRGGSMIVISSSSSMAPSFAPLFGGGSLFSPPSPFMSPAGGRPHVVMMGAGSGQPLASSMSGAHSMSPILRAILGNVMSDLSSAASAAEDKSRARFAGASRRSMWAAPSIEDEADSWDEREPRLGGRFVRVRQRSLNDQQVMDDRGNDDTTGDSSSDSLMDQLLDSPMGPLGSSMRQTFRGPGEVTVERLIEMPPAGDAHRAHPNPLEGVRSQSISRMDSAPTAESLARPMFASQPSSQSQSHQTTSLGQRFVRFMQDLAPPAGGPMLMSAPPPSVGLVDRLLGDLTGASGRLMSQQQQQIKSRQDMIDEDLDEGDGSSAADEPGPGLAPKWSPKISVATGRLRMIHPANRRGDSPAILMAPPRLTFAASEPANLDEMGRIDSGQTSANSNKFTSSSEEPFEASMNNGQQLKQQQQPSPVANEHSSPFTSPSSPLFGFPAMASSNNQAAPSSDEKRTVDAKQHDNSNNSNNANGNDGHQNNHRQQRAFVYHSNHELAGGHSSQVESRSSGDQQQVAPALGLIGRPRSFMPVQSVAGLPPPASIVMGRRLDDGPFASVDAKEGSMLD